jgi:hypothetical protein
MGAPGGWQTGSAPLLVECALPWTVPTLSDAAALGRVSGDVGPAQASGKEHGMMMTAQVSVDPLGQPALDPPIQQAITRLRAAGLIVESGAMSTIVAGEAEVVFETLRQVFGELAGQGQPHHGGHVFQRVPAARPLTIRPLPSRKGTHAQDGSFSR